MRRARGQQIVPETDPTLEVRRIQCTPRGGGVPVELLRDQRRSGGQAVTSSEDYGVDRRPESFTRLARTAAGAIAQQVRLEPEGALRHDTRLDTRPDHRQPTADYGLTSNFTTDWRL